MIMPKLDGLGVLDKIQNFEQKPKVIMIKEFSKEEPEVSYEVPAQTYVQEVAESNNENNVFVINKEIEKISAESIKNKIDNENN